MIRRTFQGLPVSVENEAGSVRPWHDRVARASGETRMLYDYGFLEDHVGADGDEVDCYLGPDEAAEFVYVVHQRAAPEYKRYDEDKVFLGFGSEAEAKAAYLAHRSDGEAAYGGMSSMRLDAFKAKLKRRTGSGKIRHEVGAQAMINMRIEHRGSKWVVLPEDGDKVLGTHDTKEDAEKQLAAIEASKARAAHSKFEFADKNGKELKPGDVVVMPDGSKDVVIELYRGGRVTLRNGRTWPSRELTATGSSSFTKFATRSTLSTFQAVRGPDGKVRVHVWDYVCVPGHDEKDGQSTDFNERTLSEFVQNFEERGDPVAIDHNHQAMYAAKNGQPAPALGFYGALAVVWGGKLAKFADVVKSGEMSYEGLDLATDGLYAYRCEVTEKGDELLPNYRYLSPTFTSQGTRRDGTPCGYQLVCVAATNEPWQAGTHITFATAPQLNFARDGEIVACPTCGLHVRVEGTKIQSHPHGGGRPDKNPACASSDADATKLKAVNLSSTPAHEGGSAHKGVQMAKLAKLSKFVGMEGEADDAKIMTALESKMEETAMEAASDEKFDYAEHAKKFEEAAQAYEDAHMDDAAGEEPPHVTMRKMAAHFRKMAKMAEPTAAPGHQEPDGDEAKRMEEMKKMAKMDEDKKAAEMAVMSATLKAQNEKLAALEAKEAAREASAKAERDAEIAAFAQSAVDGGYPADSRDSLIAFARADLPGARKLVAPFIKDRPAHLMGRLTNGGFPVGKGKEGRDSSGPAKPRVVQSMGWTFIEQEGPLADETKKLAESKEPILMEKVDKLLPESQRNVMFYRHLAAEKIVRAERPDLVPVEEAE